VPSKFHEFASECLRTIFDGGQALHAAHFVKGAPVRNSGLQRTCKIKVGGDAV
jgi:hypothetical protein